MNDAVKHKQDEVADILRAKGSLLKMDECDAAVILCDAAYNDDLQTLKRYIRNGVSPNVGDYDSRTGTARDCELPPLSGGDPDQQQGQDGQHGTGGRHQAWPSGGPEGMREKGALLHGHAVTMCEAGAKGDIDTIRVLIENGVDANEGDYDGRTCLHLAACEKQLGVIHFLLTCHTHADLPFAKPVAINPVDNMGGTPLDDAIRHGHTVVEVLLRQVGGICKEDHEALEEAKRVQSKFSAERLNTKVDSLVAATIANCVEAQLLSRMVKFQQQVGALETALEIDIQDLVAELQEYTAMEQQYNQKTTLKINETAKRQVSLENMHAKLSQLLETLLEWTTFLENAPQVTPSVIERLVTVVVDERGEPAPKIRRTIGFGDEQLGEAKVEEAVENIQDQDAILIERLHLFSDVVSCLVSMMDAAAGGS
eukprot:CAMPEP_0117692482 /NCGR_PEP_ID=MMETSP0804-20121206/26355_1 /TAXON_ID=1074897 /ORGANISM="Tetraselmis astigmatica, Strain CCMP880" /LENGTH=424 /DNA_ID=CAMNT_0005505941 /DNA_START=38 /DNA_END=1313 /DNA_ORIENTATION=+